MRLNGYSEHESEPVRTNKDVKRKSVNFVFNGIYKNMPFIFLSNFCML
jgi:hypothetical protein